MWRTVAANYSMQGEATVPIHPPRPISHALCNPVLLHLSQVTKPLNQNFFLSHSLFMGNAELGTGGGQMLKAPIGTYEFGANVISEHFMMLGRIATDGRLSGRLKYDIAEWLGCKLHMQLSNEPGQSQVRIRCASFCV